MNSGVAPHVCCTFQSSTVPQEASIVLPILDKCGSWTQRQPLDPAVRFSDSARMHAATTEEGLPPATKASGAMNGDSMPHQPVDEKKESPSADGYIASEVHSMHGVPQMMSGMPPSQVYVEMGYHGMAGFDTQFQALGVGDAHDSSNHESSEGNDASGEGSNEEGTVKLFIGQVSSERLKDGSEEA
jgi:hypothetical protein